MPKAHLGVANLIKNNYYVGSGGVGRRGGGR
jgi:hypothetical protein